MLALLVFVAPSYASLGAPTLTTPGVNPTVDAAPTFQWAAVAGADHYAFQLGGSTGFNPPQYSVSTKNTRVALTATIANGDYTWRVAAVTATGVQGPWSTVRSFTMDWADVAQPQSPADNATLTYPQPLLLDWTSVQGSPQYKLTISSSDPQQGVNQITGSPITTSATAYAIPTRLSDGEYWWQVTPIDAEGNEGTPSPWFTFNWSWPTDTTLTLNDLDPSSQVFDPQFSWTAVAGAAYYKVDVNNDPNFPSGSNVCCSGVHRGHVARPHHAAPGGPELLLARDAARLVPARGRADRVQRQHRQPQDLHHHLRRRSRRRDEPEHARRPGQPDHLDVERCRHDRPDRLVGSGSWSGLIRGRGVAVLGLGM